MPKCQEKGFTISIHVTCIERGWANFSSQNVVASGRDFFSPWSIQKHRSSICSQVEGHSVKAGSKMTTFIIDGSVVVKIKTFLPILISTAGFSQALERGVPARSCAKFYEKLHVIEKMSVRGEIGRSPIDPPLIIYHKRKLSWVHFSEGTY